MRLRHAAFAACAAALFLPLAPAVAHEHHDDGPGRYDDDRPGDWREGRDPRPPYDPAREAWLADCRHRVDPRDRRSDGPDQCEAYLNDYYARAYGGRPQGGYPGYDHGAQPVYGYAQGCCGTVVPMMMVPVVQAKPECTETIEYIYEDVPVKRKIYRAPVRTKIVPDKRIKIVPDKRLRVK
jgi:hypothetical protein